MHPTNLYCLPFSGGNFYSYRLYEQLAPAFLKVKPLEYPGRGTRAREELIRKIELLTDNLYDRIKDGLDNGDYAFYGHSLGGLVAYLLTRKILEHNHCPPAHLFISGTPGPASGRDEKTHLLSRNAFIEKLRKLEGCPDEILDNKDLFDYFEPILRADFELSGSYSHLPHAPLAVPITVITGTEEELDLADIRLWQQETEYAVDFLQLPGNHFFIFEHAAEILSIIIKKLSRPEHSYPPVHR